MAISSITAKKIHLYFKMDLVEFCTHRQRKEGQSIHFHWCIPFVTLRKSILPINFTFSQMQIIDKFVSDDNFTDMHNIHTFLYNTLVIINGKYNLLLWVSHFKSEHLSLDKEWYVTSVPHQKNAMYHWT